MKELKTTPEMQGTDSKNAPAAKKERKPLAKYITIAERFKDVPDVVWDEQCQTYLTGRLAAITMNRKAQPGNGLKWKRGEYESLVERGLWEAKAMSAEFLLIAQKKSRLSVTLRNYIETLLTEGMNSTLEHYLTNETKRATKKAKADEKAK